MTPDRKAHAEAIRDWLATAGEGEPVVIPAHHAAAIADILDPPPRAGEIVMRVAVGQNSDGQREVFLVGQTYADDEAAFAELEQWDYPIRLGIGVLRFPPPVVPVVEGEVE